MRIITIYNPGVSSVSIPLGSIIFLKMYTEESLVGPCVGINCVGNNYSISIPRESTEDAEKLMQEIKDFMLFSSLSELKIESREAV